MDSNAHHILSLVIWNKQPISNQRATPESFEWWGVMNMRNAFCEWMFAPTYCIMLLLWYFMVLHIAYLWNCKSKPCNAETIYKSCLSRVSYKCTEVAKENIKWLRFLKSCKATFWRKQLCDISESNVGRKKVEVAFQLFRRLRKELDVVASIFD